MVDQPNNIVLPRTDTVIEVAQQDLPAPAALFAEALALARSTPDRDDRDEAYGRIAEAHARAGDYQAARALFRNIGDGEVRDDAMETVALTAARAGAFDVALDTANGLVNVDRKAQTQGRIARERAQAGDIPAGIAIADRIAAVDTRVITLGFIAEIAARANQREAVEQTVARTREAMARLTEPGMRDTMATIVAAARARGGDHRDALDLALTVVDPQARASALNELAAIAVAAGAAPAAIQVTETLLAAARDAQNDTDRVRMLADGAELQLATGSPTAAQLTLQQATMAAENIRDQSERYDAHARIGAASARIDADAAIAAARSLTDLDGRPQNLAAIATTLALTGRAAQALALVREINEPTFREDARRRAILALAATDIRQALAALERVPQAQRAIILTTLLEERAAAGDAAGALAAAERITDASTRSELLYEAVRVLARDLRNIAGALRLAERIATRELREDALVEIAEAQARAGELRAALATARSLRLPANRAAALALVAARFPRR